MTSSETPAQEPANEQSHEESLAKTQQLREQERKAASDLHLGMAVIPMMISAVALVVTFFLPHSGNVLGFDVLMDSDIAQANHTAAPERIYTIFVVLGVLLTIATLLSRTTVVAFVTWAVSCVQAVYSIFAGWMRQSRPVELGGEGINYGLMIGIFFSMVLAITMSIMAFRRSNLQKAIAAARRKHADSDPVSQAQQVYLRSGLMPNTSTDVSVVDDRRARARARNQKKA